MSRQVMDITRREQLKSIRLRRRRKELGIEDLPVSVVYDGQRFNAGVKGVDAKPKVRVIVNPLSQLQPAESGTITLTGVHSVTSLTYDFAHINDPVPDGGGEELDAQATHK